MAHSGEIMLGWLLRSGEGHERVTISVAGVLDLAEGVRLVVLKPATCLLASGGAAAVNGRPAPPLVVLLEGDEVRAGEVRFVLEAEVPATVTFAPHRMRICCARCHDALAEGDQVVTCPSCGSAHHAECWPYGPRCAGCDLETAPSGAER